MESGYKVQATIYLCQEGGAIGCYVAAGVALIGDLAGRVIISRSACAFADSWGALGGRGGTTHFKQEVRSLDLSAAQVPWDFAMGMTVGGVVGITTKGLFTPAGRRLPREPEILIARPKASHYLDRR